MNKECPAVLLLMFNRPDLASQVLDVIRSAKPSRLYLAVDGPRKEKEGEKLEVEKCKLLQESVDWPCEVHTKYESVNLGCGVAVRIAIDWFFTHEEEGIVLEDDTLPDESFFDFCSDLLEKYRDDKRIMSIAGYTDLEGEELMCGSYDYSNYNLIWGWASWRRAWELHKFSSQEMRDALASDWFIHHLGGKPEVAEYWRQQISDALDERINTWDYQWRMSIWLNNGLSVLPKQTLVQNIGFDERATHTTVWHDKCIERKASRIEFPLHYPVSIRRNYGLDKALERVRFKIAPKAQPSWKVRIKRKIKRILYK